MGSITSEAAFQNESKTFQINNNSLLKTWISQHSEGSLCIARLVRFRGVGTTGTQAVLRLLNHMSH